MEKITVFILGAVLSVLIYIPVFANETERELSKTIRMRIDSPIISINGDERPFDAEGSAPVIENDRTLVPLRAIFEALSVDLQWDDATQTITGKRGNAEIILKIGQNEAFVNGKSVTLDVPPKIINDRTMVPLRFISESIGAKVEWLAAERGIIITQTDPYITLGGVTVALNDTLTYVESVLGKADRVEVSGYDFSWHVFNKDYSRFIMVGVKGGLVEALYSNTKGFKTHGAAYGDVGEIEGLHGAVTLYYDDNEDGGMVHACMIISMNAVSSSVYNDDFFRAQELQVFDATNTFRVNHSLHVLQADAIADLTARSHSKDMAEKDFFSHVGLNGSLPWDRFEANGGRFTAAAENIAGGYLFGVDAFDGWVNSPNHRDNLLRASVNFMGAGYAYNRHSTYWYYVTHFFYAR
jgi:hypothetical protein